jgi:hypothetical protein
MVFKLRSLFPARRSLSLPRVSMPVLDTNSLRESALRASWQRDQRVARRRLAIRWTLWWLWKYRFFILAACALLAALIYLLYRTGVIGPWTADAPTPAERGIPLRLDRQLKELSQITPNQRPPPPDAPAPLQLKPASQLKIKESSP